MSKKPTVNIQDIDKLFHEKSRLGIMTTLAAHPVGILFPDLRELNDLTDGNLNRHLKVLCDAGFVKSRKSDRGRNSKTRYQITKNGLRGFIDYLNQMELVLQKAAAATEIANKNVTQPKARPATR